MAGQKPSAPFDALALRTRLRTLRIGVWPSVFICAVIAIYARWTEAGPHRVAILAMCAAGAVLSILLARAPVEPLLRGRWREPFFLAWSASCIGMIAAGCVLDGGAGSPIAVALFLPLAYASLSYPLRPMLAVAAVDIGAYLGLALTVGGARPAYVFILTASLAGAAWICAWQAHDLDAQRRELAQASRTDPLTGALNRRGFEERLAAELDHARRHRRPATLVLLDLDRFKQVNDTSGHAAGDELLCWVVATLQQHVRRHDAVGRLGGDEFALILDEAEEPGGQAVGRLSRALGERTGASAGHAVFPADGQDPETLHRHADAALYAEKHSTRDTASRFAGRASAETSG
jgi:diguanylate cyclase (GGDEF)-like protein